MGKSNLLGICSVCKKIRISNNPSIWMSRDSNPSLYDIYMDEFKDNLTHGYCPEDFKKKKEELEEFKRNYGF